MTFNAMGRSRKRVTDRTNMEILDAFRNRTLPKVCNTKMRVRCKRQSSLFSALEKLELQASSKRYKMPAIIVTQDKTIRISGSSFAKVFTENGPFLGRIIPDVMK